MMALVIIRRGPLVERIILYARQYLIIIIIICITADRAVLNVFIKYVGTRAMHIFYTPFFMPFLQFVYLYVYLYHFNEHSLSIIIIIVASRPSGDVQPAKKKKKS